MLQAMNEPSGQLPVLMMNTDDDTHVVMDCGAIYRDGSIEGARADPGPLLRALVAVPTVWGDYWPAVGGQ
jgi:hypothetical protein